MLLCVCVHTALMSLFPVARWYVQCAVKPHFNDMYKRRNTQRLDCQESLAGI